MHELPVILGILNTVQRTAEENHLCSVTKICLRIGELSDLVEECMQIYFDSASEGTVCEGSQLVIVRNPAKLRCTVCGYEFPHEHAFSCPVCGGSAEWIRGSGSGCVVESIEGEA